VIVLWLVTPLQARVPERISESAAVFVVAIAIGLVAFSPLIEQTVARGPLSFLAVLPLILAALLRGQRDTATVALILSCFAVWGTLMNGGPFARTTLNDSFLLLLAFIISTAVPSLVLSADVAMRRTTEASLRAAREALEQQVRHRTGELGQAIAALQAEVEERREIETKLQEQQVHLVEAQRLANFGSWSWDIASGRVDWSQQIYEIYGIRPSEFRATFEDYLERVHPDDRERVRAVISATLQSGGAFRIEERIVRPNGEVRILQSIGEVVHGDHGEAAQMLGVCQDITDQKSALSALRQSEERYRLLVESVRDYAIFMLDSDGHVRSWNAGAAHIKRYTESEILGRHFSCFYTEEDRASGQPQLVLEIAAQGKFETEGWRVRKDGSRFWASVVIDPIRDGEGKLLGFVKIVRDITDRRETQTTLDETREMLAQAQKMEALGQLTGGIAHDFNNLLMIVSGHAEMLRNRLSDERSQKAIAAIASAAGRGENLTRQLLAFSRRQPLSPVVVDVKDRIEAVRDMLGSSLRGNIDLRLEIADDLWPTRVDPSELELALVNVAVNARDAMPDGGRVTLSARNVTLRSRGRAGDLDGDFIELAMADTGTGIPRDVLSKVFEPFFTTKAVGKGTGLGLSQVYGFAHQSGGTVRIQSEVGHGTTIAIYLPRSQSPVAASVPESGAQPATRGHGTILVVEDNAEVAEVTATLLAQFGYRVLRASNAAEALAQLDCSDVDLVFSDVVMPGPMDGLALGRAVRANHPNTPVLLTSGYTDLAPEAEIEFSILRKPFHMAALEAAVRKALQRGQRQGAVSAPA
jgi:PAS domain S-box-containing protein